MYHMLKTKTRQNYKNEPYLNYRNSHQSTIIQLQVYVPLKFKNKYVYAHTCALYIIIFIKSVTEHF